MKEVEVKIAHIVAYDEKGIIGKGDDLLPWELKRDLKHFRDLTTGHVVIMGRKTHFSIGRPLPNRKNIVISRNPECLKDVTAVCSIDAAIKTGLEYAKVNGHERIFIIGGGEIYKRTADIADEAFVTLVKGEHDGDRYYTLPENMQQVSCQGAMYDGVETFFFKHYARIA